VVHSGAGALVPVIAARAGPRLRSVVFVDALLPHPGRSWFETAPPELADRLRSRARNGRVPPWTRWLPAPALAALLPDVEVRRTLAASAPPIPLAFLDQPAPMVSMPRCVPCAYLQLNAASAREAREARALGWPVRRLDGDHLWIMTWPDRVADALLASTRGDLP
jgi:hypothetical protein